MRGFLAPALLVIQVSALASVGAAADVERLLFHAETVDGRVIASRNADRLFNPASVVKVGTSLHALEVLGADHRYATEVGFSGVWEQESGTIRGDLVIRGGGDPDFHVENVILVARELNRLGIRSVTGDLVVTGSLWSGWENGTTHRITDEARRVRVMGRRVADAFDPARWGHTPRASWEALCTRRGWDPSDPPGVKIAGTVRGVRDPGCTVLVRHWSNPLPVLLKRFNVFSNNDIIRVAQGLGGVAAVEAHLRDRLGAAPAQLQLTTASGEGRNRMSARRVVGLLRGFQNALSARGLSPRDVMPVLGCDPGPTRRMFPELARAARTGAVTCKTGTLTNTDGGVAVLAGWFAGRDAGDVLFCVAAPRAGGRLRQWRLVEQGWLLDLMSRAGGARTAPCGPELPFSDTRAEVEVVWAAGSDTGTGTGEAR